jgi:large repetitive protein
VERVLRGESGAMKRTLAIGSGMSGKVNVFLAGIVLFGVAVVSMTLYTLLTGGGGGGGLDGANRSDRTELSPLVETDVFRENGEDSLSSEENLYAQPVGVDGLDVKWYGNGYNGIRGRVVDQAGTPVTGAQIVATRIRTLKKTINPARYTGLRDVSGTGGVFTFDGIPLGSYSLVAVVGEQSGRTEAVAASRRTAYNGKDREYEIVLKPSGILAGCVVDSGGNPVPKALVVPTKMQAAMVATDGQGRFAIDRLEAGVHDLMVVADRFAPLTVRDLLTGKEDIEISLDRGHLLRGRVLFDGKPQSGVTVTTMALGKILYDDSSGSDGTFELGPLPAGRNSIRIEPGEYCAPLKTVRFAGEEPVLPGVEIHLERTGSLGGTVTDGETGEPLPGIWMNLAGDRSAAFHPPQHLLNVRTDSEGRFLFCSLPPCGYSLSAKRAGPYIPALWQRGKTISVKPGERSGGTDIILDRGAAAVVTVRGVGGGAISGARIRISAPDRTYNYFEESRRRAPLPEAVEVGDGRYLIGGLRAGVFNVTPSRRGWISKSELLALGAYEEEVSLEVELEPAFSVTGKVLDPGGTGIAGAWVAFSSEGAITDTDGTFVVNNMAPKRSSAVEIRAAGFVPFKGRSGRIDEEIDPLEFTLTPEGTHYIAGTVRNDRNDPLVRVEVSISQRDGSNRVSRKALTDERGGFRFDGLLEGNVRISTDSIHGVQRRDPRSFPVDRNDTALIVDRYACIRGRALDGNRQPLSVFSAGTAWGNGLRRISSRRNLRSVEDFVDGTFDLAQVPPGEVAVGVLTRDGRSGRSEQFVVAPGGVVENVIVAISGGGTVSGRVVDGVGGPPVGSAAVHVEEKKGDEDSGFPRFAFGSRSATDAITGPDGTFVVENVDPGTVSVWADHGDFGDSAKLDVAIAEGKTVDGLEIILVKGSTVEGCVTVDGVPEAGVGIQADEDNDRERYFGANSPRAVSGKDGRYRIGGLAPGTFTIQARLKGDKCWRDLSIKVDVGEGMVVTRDVAFPRGGTIEGKVRLVDEAVGDVSIRVSKKKEEGVEDSRVFYAGATSQRDGSYRIEGLLPGRYHLGCSYRKGGSSYSLKQDIDVGGGVVLCDLNFGVGNNCEVNGYITENGIALPDQRITCRGDSGRFSTQSDENGFYRFTSLADGRVTVYARFSAGAGSTSFTISKSLDLEEGGVVPQNLDFKTGSGVITGVITTNGDPARFAYVQVKGDEETGTGAVSVTTFAEGGEFRIGKLPPGRYTLSTYEPRRMHQVVQVTGSGETRLDFSFRTGKSGVRGLVARPERSEGERVSAYIFNPGVCTWKSGDPFVSPGYSDGLITETGSIGKDGSFRVDSLAPERVDVVAVRVLEGKIIGLDVRQVSLVDKENSEVNLSVLE